MKNLVLMFLLLTFTQNSVAASESQEKPSALEVYADLRKDLRAKYGENFYPDYGLAVVAQKLNDTSAQLEFFVIGRLARYSIEVQPINLQGNNRTEAGELSTIEEAAPSGITSPGYSSEPVMTIPVTKLANALEIKWIPEADNYQSPTTLVISLEGVPSTGAFGINSNLPSLSGTIENTYENAFGKSFSPATPNASTQSCSCVTVRARSRTCGTICDYCKNSIGNRVDLVDCVINCGTQCTTFERQGCGPILCL